MPLAFRYILVFLAGVICGAALLNSLASPDAGAPGEARNAVTTAVDLAPPQPAEAVPEKAVPDPLSTAIDEMVSGYETQSIPDAYRNSIGPIVRRPTFGEIYRKFESEPVDEPWAWAMEHGLNDFIAVHGPRSGEVFDFVQCRSSYCVVAGYKLDSMEASGASIISELTSQSWWQGGASAYSSSSSEQDRRRFVVLLPGYED